MKLKDLRFTNKNNYSTGKTLQYSITKRIAHVEADLFNNYVDSEK